MGIPLALLLGCKKIVTIGWDLGDPKTSTTDWKHFYSKNIKLEGNKKTGPMGGEIESLIKSTDVLYDWCVNKGIDLKILSEISYISPKFPRITLNDIK